MSMDRFYCENITEPVCQLDGAEARHIVKVMRAKVGDKLELFDGKGTLAESAVEELAGKKVILKILQITKDPPRNEKRITIAASVAKGERFDWLISKCTELGVDKIVPVIFERTVKQPKNEKIVDRWNNLAISAAKQCKRLYLPEIIMPIQLKDAIEESTGQILFGSCDKDSQKPDSLELAGDTVVFIGPEGGMTEVKEELLISSGAKAISICNTILRVETAAVAFAAILAAKRG